MSVGGVAVFPADTVYGLACDPSNREAVERLYALKRRRLDKPSAVMFFELDLALATLPELGPDTRVALARLMPAPVTVLLPNPEARYPLACGDDAFTLGLRVPVIEALHGVRWPVLQSSANVADGPEARRLDEVPDSIRRAADMVIEGGELPGTASTVIDLRGYERDRSWAIVRQGAVSESVVEAALAGQFHFDPAGYEEMIRDDIPDYDQLQDELVAVSGNGARRVLELGTGTGETASRLLERHPGADLVGIDESTRMLEVARARLPSDQVSLHVARLQDRLPDGPFDLVASALCVHHLLGDEKRDLFERIHAVLAPGGRFVLADVVIAENPGHPTITLTPGYDNPSTLAQQLEWLGQAGFDARATWADHDLAVMLAQRPGV
jgi:tRNA threonylcarbamoyl adenosine modification protein (Sua5/YciO/YrdC/YwlC family)